MTAIEPVNGHHDHDLELIRRTVAPGATNDELAMYLHDCKRRGVHPLDRMLHFTVRTDRKTGARKYTPVTSIDLFRARAGSTGQHAGTDDAVFDVPPEGKVPMAATVTVYRLVGGTRCPFTATARWFEYKPQEDFMWNKMPFTMLAKCAEALALRKAFPAELGGLYTVDEMAQAPAADPHMSPEANTIPVQEQLAARQANPRPRKEYCTQAQQDALRDIADEMGLDLATRSALIAPFNVKRAASLSAAECDQVILGLLRQRVSQLLNAVGWNLDDVKNESPLVLVDEPEELDIEQANAALAVLRKAKNEAGQ